MAVIFISALFTVEMISYTGGQIVSIFYILLAALLYMYTFISSDRRSMFIRWLVSIPLSYPVWKWFVDRDFLIRALNMVFPGYGEQSGGGAFAALFLWVVLAIAVSCAIVVSLLVRPKLSRRFCAVQTLISIVMSIMIVAAILFLERQFPSAEEVLLYIGS